MGLFVGCGLWGRAVPACRRSTPQSQMASSILSTCTGVERPVYWLEGKLHLIDQRELPAELLVFEVHTVAGTIKAIKDMAVRGAPAIGAAGAFGLVLAANTSSAVTPLGLVQDLQAAKKELDESRPTAVNLTWATGRVVDVITELAAAPGMTVEKLRSSVLEEAQALAEEDVKINTAIARHGFGVVPDNANILHHCNTGALATVDVGTALGVIYECHKRGKGIHVWVDETRPRLQGAKLTAWELMRGGVPMHLIADNAAGHLMQRGKVDVVLFGADRVAANGDVANKIGTYKICVVARENGVAAYACVPTSTIDLTVSTGLDIPIEERSAEEVTMVGETRIAPLGVPVFNPAFDVTPARYITGIITEEGICYPPFSVSLRAAKLAAEARREAEWKAKLAALHVLAAAQA